LDFKPIDRFTHNFRILLRVALNIYYELFYKQLLIFYKCNSNMVWIVHHFAPFSCFVYTSHDFWMNRKWKQQSFANLIEFEISNDCQSMQWFWKWFNWMKTNVEMLLIGMNGYDDSHRKSSRVQELRALKTMMTDTLYIAVETSFKTDVLKLSKQLIFISLLIMILRLVG
jgi:hypothetical protein